MYLASNNASTCRYINIMPADSYDKLIALRHSSIEKQSYLTVGLTQKSAVK